MEGGCLGYPGASTVANQPLDRIPLTWLANPHNPTMSPHSRHPSTLIKSVEGKKREGGVGERGQTIARSPLLLPKKRLLEENQTCWDWENQQRELLEDTNRWWNTNAKTRLNAAGTNHVSLFLNTWPLTKTTPAKLDAVNFVKYHLTKWDAVIIYHSFCTDKIKIKRMLFLTNFIKRPTSLSFPQWLLSRGSTV